MPTQTEVEYVRWQNRATRFYMAARLLHSNEMFAPAAYCASQAIELLLKATLVFWDKSFNPEAAGHAMAKLLRSVRNKAPNAKQVQVPEYLNFEKRYQSVSRYPSGSKGIGIPASFMSDLDAAFASLLSLVPFQFNTELKRALTGKDRKAHLALKRRNAEVSKLWRLLGVSAKPYNKPLHATRENPRA